jgi:hypothetical protein
VGRPPLASRSTDGDVLSGPLKRRIKELEDKVSELLALLVAAGRTERELRERSRWLESRVQLLEQRQWGRELDRENVNPEQGSDSQR